MPAVLGQPYELWKKYDESIHPQFSLEFTVAAFRYGHSEISRIIPRFNKDNQPTSEDDLLFRENLFDPLNGLHNDTIEPGIRGICRQSPGLVDTIMVSDTR